MKKKTTAPAVKPKQPAPKKNIATDADKIPPTNKPFSKEVWLTLLEVATTLSISIYTLYSWCRKGLLPYYKIGREIRFAETEISETIKKYRRTGRWQV
jgi:excisionase family DNA binding protein